MVRDAGPNRLPAEKAAPEDELDRLRALVAHAHEKSDRFGLRKIWQRLTSRFRARDQKKVIVEPIETKTANKDAA